LLCLQKALALILIYRFFAMSLLFLG
jgi:hypothetical protein